MHLARLPVLLLVAALAFPAPAARAQSVLSDAFAATNAGLSPEERPGARSGCSRRRSTTASSPIPTRSGSAAAIDWYEFLRADRRGDLFDAWGAIPDPDCCVPGDPDCPARSPTETYGLLWCPGDDALLAFVGREGYVDPACDFEDAPFDALDAARRGRPAAVGLRPPLRHLDRGARLPEVPEPAVRRRGLGADRRLGGLRGVPVRRSRRPGQPAEPALGRLGRAAGADRHGLRRLPHRLRPGEPAGRPRPSGAGRTSTRWSATSTAGCRTCSATGCRRTGSSGS